MNEGMASISITIMLVFYYFFTSFFSVPRIRSHLSFSTLFTYLAYLKHSLSIYLVRPQTPGNSSATASQLLRLQSSNIMALYTAVLNHIYIRAVIVIFTIKNSETLKSFTVVCGC